MTRKIIIHKNFEKGKRMQNQRIAMFMVSHLFPDMVLIFSTPLHRPMPYSSITCISKDCYEFHT